MPDPSASSEAPADLAIIGAGVAGTYVAHRMIAARPGWRVALYERSSRIGGRLLSLPVDGIERVRAELGGMRYRTSQPLVSAIVRELGLETRPFRTAFDDNRYLLRGVRWRLAEPEHAASVYNLAPAERGRTPAEVLLTAFDKVVPRSLELNDADWVEVKRTQRFQGRLLRDWSVHDLLAATLSTDGHRYVVDGFGYATLLDDERNAADTIPWLLIEARPELENHTLTDGMERLPRALAASFELSGGSVRLAHRLVGLEREDSAVRLRFADGPDAKARRVVLALPRPALEEVQGNASLMVDTEARSMLAAVSAHAASKLFLGYHNAWWRAGGFQGMRTVTDLPLSKTYYFDLERDHHAAPAPLAILLASYADGPNRDHWRSLAETSALVDDLPYDSDERWTAYAASTAQVAEAQAMLKQAHPDDEVSDPVASAFMDWPDGAWHTWRAGVSSQDVMDRMPQPLPDLPVYVCGEAYSWSQGWVEGALETAEAVIERLSR